MCDTMDEHNVNIAITITITMMSMSCVRPFGLDSLVDYFNVETCDIWEENVTTRREI